ncbi:phosphonate C-P lyase system protein PhnG [Trinickia violacea]|uniref:Phosphonate C-P lyase system protein PhnG n=1 Tax=Trinickia violacea TaxID=2571746 RepID=A0A4P8J2R9_9BURK|nr:phosphonate C-P lyase system protein PhnG [Trinickia violacea]QCP54034.1 phosphonate C-P lyase system protein PhnG [Trinickia violacea]
MSATVAPSPHSRRRAWLAVLARAPRADLETALTHAFEGAELPAYEWLRAPEIGLAMVRGRIGGTGDPFNLGEATVTRATLRLKGISGSDGAAPVGVACQLGRDKRRAELAALADALLQVPERHAALNERLIEPLAARMAAQRETRRQDAASTRVEFFTMVRGD